MVDLIVIGAGSGGLAAAKRAASYGKTVILCENDTIGGTCVSFGCVPKKLWHGVAHFKHTADIASEHGWEIKSSFKWTDVQPKIKSFIQTLNDRHEQKCLDQSVTIIKGTASFVNSNTISINNKTYSANDFLIAVGSKAERLPFKGSELCDTSYEFFSWTTQPKTVAIIGGGYIAVELASILNALGTTVHIIIRKDTVLRGFDDDIRNKLHESYINRGIIIHNNQTIESIQKNNDQLEINLNDNNKLIVDKAIQAVGRTPNTGSLNCENASIKTTSNGAVICNKNYQTSIKNIHAIGDCLDHIQLTPVAIAQARQWVDHIYTKKDFPVNYYWIPTAIFSLPEAATIGLTEEQAKKEYEV